MIERIRIRNFKNLHDLQIDLEPFTVFVGPNGCGKTSVLEAIHLLASPLPDASKPPVAWFRTFDEEGEVQITASTPNGELKLVGSTDGKFESSGTAEIPRAIFLQLDAKLLLESPPASRDTASWSLWGEGLPYLVSGLKDHPTEFESMILAVQKVIPQFKGLRVEENDPPRLFLDLGNHRSIPAWKADEGTLMVLALMTSIFNTPRACLLLIDDLDRGLHPMTQKRLIAELHEIVERESIQILATTHSPYLLDELRLAEVRIMSVGERGHALCGKLTDHPKYEKWKGEFDPGELWSFFGEDWLIPKGVAQ